MKGENVIRSLFQVFWPPVVVFCLHMLRQIFLPSHIEIDVVAHFLGGLSMAWVAWNIHRFWLKRTPFKELSFWYQAFVYVAFAELVGTLWEMMEFYILLGLIPSLPLTYADTISDLTMDLTGAIVFVALLGLVRRRSRL